TATTQATLPATVHCLSSANLLNQPFSLDFLLQIEGRMQGPQHTRQPEPISKPPISIYQFSGLDHSRACQHMKVTWWQNATLQSTTPVYYPLVTLVTKLSIPFKSHYCNINNSPRDTY
ncbi:hypothetical protein SUGI_0359620, partial [Cryptomeria japonica]